MQHAAGQGLAVRVDDGERLAADRGVIVAVGHQVDRHFGGVDQALRVVQLLEGRHRRSRQGHRLSRLALAAVDRGLLHHAARLEAAIAGCRVQRAGALQLVDGPGVLLAKRVGGGQLPPRLAFDARLPFGLGAPRDGFEQAHGAIAFAGQEGVRGVAQQRGEIVGDGRLRGRQARGGEECQGEAGGAQHIGSIDDSGGGDRTERRAGGAMPARPSLLAGFDSRAHQRRERRAAR